MSKCKHLIGEVNSAGDFNEVITADELTRYFTSDDIIKNKPDIRSSNGFYGLYKFNYCPNCGAKIDWDKIETDLLTNKK